MWCSASAHRGVLGRFLQRRILKKKVKNPISICFDLYDRAAFPIVIEFFKLDFCRLSDRLEFAQHARKRKTRARAHTRDTLSAQR